MKKKFLVLFCFVILSVGPVFSVSAITDEQKTAIVDRCDSIKEDLKSVQKMDARARVFLGSHYETIYSDYITALNVRLVENSLTEVDLIENQDNFSKAKNVFGVDYVKYQQELETLIGINCKTDPKGFYNQLEVTREKRGAVLTDIKKMRSIVLKNIDLATGLKEKL